MDLASHNTLNFGERVAARPGDDVVSVSLLVADAYSHEVSACDWPDTLIVHVVYLEHILLLFEYFNFHQLRIKLFERFFLLEEFYDFFHWKGNNVDSFGSCPMLNVDFELLTGIFCNLDPSLRIFKFFDSPDDFHTCHLVLNL